MNLEKIVASFHVDMSSQHLGEIYMQVKQCRKNLATGIANDAHTKIMDLGNAFDGITGHVAELRRVVDMPSWLCSPQVEAYANMLMEAVLEAMPGIAQMSDAAVEQEIIDRVEICKLPINADQNYRRLSTLLRFREKQRQKDVEILETKQLHPVKPVERMDVAELEKEIKERERTVHEIKLIDLNDQERAHLSAYYDANMRRLKALTKETHKRKPEPEPDKLNRPIKIMGNLELRIEMQKLRDDAYTYLELNIMRRRDVAHELHLRKTKLNRPTLREMTVSELDNELMALKRAEEANRKKQYEVNTRRSGILEGYDGVREDHEAALKERFRRSEIDRIDELPLPSEEESMLRAASERSDEVQLPNTAQMCNFAAAQQSETIRKDLYKAEVIQTHVHTFTYQELEEWLRMATGGGLDDVLAVIVKEMQAREKKAVEDLLYNNVTSPIAIKSIKEKLGL